MAKIVSSPILQLIRSVAEDHGTRDLPDQELLRRFNADREEAAGGDCAPGRIKAADSEREGGLCG